MSILHRGSERTMKVGASVFLVMGAAMLGCAERAPDGRTTPDGGGAMLDGAGATLDGRVMDGIDGSIESSDAGNPEEICGNGLDDDHDGTSDEDCVCTSGQTQSCYGGPPSSAGVGMCARGEQSCSRRGEFDSWGECTGWVAPSSEICGDGIDQDCDGADLGCRSCGDAPSGFVERRTVYEAAVVGAGETCREEEQTRTCNDGTWTAWSGSFAEPECAVDGPECTEDGRSAELLALPNGGTQNCQGGPIPFTNIQARTAAWSGCCGTLVRVCAVSGLSPENTMYCDSDALTTVCANPEQKAPNLWQCPGLPPR